MRIAMDKAGRIVVPKAVRESLGLRPETELRLLVDGGGFRVEPAEWQGRSVLTGDDGLPVLAGVEGPDFDTDDVRSLRDELQR